ncbi:DUF2142 domain-containing protein [Enterococcus cecorum]|uniref:DUF2142 domain-containing protein n=2 Tax=Enterococcus cecorum TaxID=44008 RepID=UPI0032C451EC
MRNNFEVDCSKLFFGLMLMFGVLSIFLSFPLSNGDEGYHLSKSYQYFTQSSPEEMSESRLRNIELNVIKQNRVENDFSIKEFFYHKLDGVEKDRFKLNILFNDSIFIRLDIAHFIPALGVLLGRAIYPSYGVMMLFGRLFNLLFFCICFSFLLKISKIGKWNLILLFTVPFMQKMASLSYDVFCYVICCTFLIELLNFLKNNTEHKQTSVHSLIICSILLLFCKKNYIILLGCWGIIFLKKIESKQVRIYIYILTIVSFLLFISILSFFHSFDLINYLKVFVNSYLNPVTMQRRGFQLFSVVSPVLPDIYNILWFIALTIVLLGEKNFYWGKTVSFILPLIFFANWLLIYTGFYFILGQPQNAFDDLSGRYLYPFLLCFLPITQQFSFVNGIVIKEKYLKMISIGMVVFIYASYLIMIFYRGYIINTTPTWR